MYKSLHLHSRYQIWSQTREADKLNRNEQWNISLIPSFLPQKIEKETNKVIKIRNFICKRSIVKCSTTNRPLCYQPYSCIHPNPKISFVLFEAQNIRLCYALWTRWRTLITFRFYAMRMPISLLHKRCLYQCYLKCVSKVQGGSRLWPLVWGSRVPAAIFAAHDKWWSCGTLASVAS